MRIGLCGITFGSVNYGVTALAISQTSLIHKCAIQNGIEPEYYVFSIDKQENVDRICSQLNINRVKVCQPARYRTGLKGLEELIENMKKCDYIFDLTKGDSFSDIYGYNRFFLQAIEKYIAIKKSILIISPQTIGPFKNPIVKKVASYLLKNADSVFARDSKSADYVRAICNKVTVKTTSDLAFYLPYSSLGKLSKTDGKLHVGINISGLLWIGGYTGKNEFGLTCNYQQFIYQLIEKLLSRENVEITLFGHVYMDGGDDDYRVCKEVNKKYPDTNLAPKFSDPIEAKSFMSKLDIVIGARMHATIGAVSSGTPALPFSYSRKFEGLYDSLDYPYVIKATKWNVQKSIEFVFDTLDKLDVVSKCAEKAVERALAKNNDYCSTIMAYFAGGNNVR